MKCALCVWDKRHHIGTDLFCPFQLINTYKEIEMTSVDLSYFNDEEKHLIAIALNARADGPEASTETLRFFTRRAMVDALTILRDNFLNEAGIAVADSALAKLTPD